MAGPATGGAKGEGEGLHVCVTCGRTDSPEWRKGPMGPKTLCNVSQHSHFLRLPPAKYSTWANDGTGLWFEMGKAK